MKFSGNKVLFTVIATLICACAQKKARLWIEPPVGHSGTNASSRSLYYRVEDPHTGKKESLHIPLNQLPQNLVVETNNKRRKGEENIAVTKADEFLQQGKLPEVPDKKVPPTLSYLRGIQEVERLFARGQHNEALIQLTPLLEQYPDQLACDSDGFHIPRFDAVGITFRGILRTCLFFDTTNFFTFIDSTNERCTIAKRGKNKQKRNDLRQFGVALLVTRKDQFPS